jgi:formate/nitrite transporter FocA (FNT family)
MGSQSANPGIGPAGPDLSPREAKKAEKRVLGGAAIVHETVRLSGEEELSRPASALAWSGLAAGLAMGFSLLTEGALRAYLPATPWRPLVTKLGYSVGFLIVIIGRQQLFTENTLTAIIPLLSRRSFITLSHVLRLWAVVLGANLAGAHIFAWVAARTAAFRPEFQRAFSEIGREAFSAGFGTMTLRGIFAGWLIALVVWTIAADAAHRLALIVILTYLIGLQGFPHVVAGSVKALFVVMTGGVSWLKYAGSYLLPTLIGNVIGGVALVSALNHAQVVSGTESRPARPQRVKQRRAS